MSPKDSRWTTEQLEILFQLEKDRVQALVDVIRSESAAKIALQKDEAISSAVAELKPRIERLERETRELREEGKKMLREMLDMKDSFAGKLRGVGVEREKGMVFTGVSTVGGGSGSGSVSRNGSGIEIGEGEWMEVERGEDNSRRLPKVVR